MPAAVQRNAIAAFRHRFTLRQTRRTVPIMFSIELVQASERLSIIGKPRRLTVSISSSPSRMLAATPRASGSSLRARLRKSRSALSASSSSQACRCLAHHGMQRLRQAPDYIAGLVNLAALDRRVRPEGSANGLAQCLGAVDDEQSAHPGIEPALDQIVDECLNNGGGLGRPFDQAERMLVAF